MTRRKATSKFIYLCNNLTYKTSKLNDKSKVEISQNFVAFSEYMNFNIAKYLASNEHTYLGLLKFVWQQIYNHLYFLQAAHLDG